MKAEIFLVTIFSILSFLDEMNHNVYYSLSFESPVLDRKSVV